MTFHTFSIGNLGAASTQCRSKGLEVGEHVVQKELSLKLECPNGKQSRIIFKAVDKNNREEMLFKAGVMARGLDEKTYCDNESMMKDSYYGKTQEE